MAGFKHARHIFTGMLSVLLCSSPLVLADDTELYVGGGGANPNAGPPNILVILDTSGSMDTTLDTQEQFNAANNYAGSCDPNRVYYSENASLPDCAGDSWFNRSAVMCAEANRAIDSAGYYTDRLSQFNDSPKKRWERINESEKDRLVECRGDGGNHGDGINTTAVWPRNGDLFPWSSNTNDQINWNTSGRSYTAYGGNYLNWSANAPIVTQDRLQVVQGVTKTLIDSVSQINVGLMRFDESNGNSEGGPVIHALEDITTARTQLKASIDSLDHEGNTPLSETLYEAGQYYAGRPVDYGLTSTPVTSVMTSRNSSNTSLYQQPTSFACQKNFIVLLTDGQPTEDVSADPKITGLPGYATLTGSTACDVNTNPNGTTDGSCLDDMAHYLFEADLDTGLPGKQNVITHTVGFDIDLPLLGSAASRGGGDYVLANDTVTLSLALSEIFTQIFQEQSSFSAPSISVNAFNRTQNMNDLFIAVFKSNQDAHWPGNLKKYQVVNGQIVGADGAPVVEPTTGFFKDNAQSFWGGVADGAEVTVSGSASQLPDPVSRNVYTFTGNPISYGGALNADLTSSVHVLLNSNANLTDAMLGIGQPGDPARPNLIDWARGVDVTDDDEDGDVLEQRFAMGDPLHSKPASVIYGGTVSNPDAVVYVTTNNGYLHAFDPSNGSELWTFIPQETLGQLPDFYDNAATTAKPYGLDGNLRTLVIDNDHNGAINGADRVYLFFGMRRGGDYYYALDVTNKNAPVLMWVKSSAELLGLGQTWSTPAVTKLDVAATPQNANNFALVFGGGYDNSQDNAGYSQDSQGAGIYMLDAVSGDLLWRAGGTGSGADLELAAMTNSIPADVKVLDMNGDDFADRMYVGDMGGRLWRFDIFNGQSPNTLVTGGVLASLGAADLATPPISENRRFYSSPDVAPVATHANGNYLHIGIGSGYRAHPLNSLTNDRFYSVRDRNVFSQLNQAQYDGLTPLVESDLIDITDQPNPTVSPTAPGWKFELRDPAEPGEKILSEARTLLGNVFFTSFLPPGGAAANPCVPGAGANRLYVLDIHDGGEVPNFDRQTTLKQRGIAPTPSFFFIPDDPDVVNCVGEACKPKLLGLIGIEAFNTPQLPPFFRTFWNQVGQIPAPPPP